MMSSMQRSCEMADAPAACRTPQRDLPFRITATGRMLQAAALPGVAVAVPAGLQWPEYGLLVFGIALASFVGGAVLVVLASIARDLAQLRAKLDSL
jgi:hypothetical protein